MPTPTDKPLMMGDAGAGALYADQDAKTVLVANFGGAKNVYVYGYAHPRPTGAPLVAIQVQLTVGGSVQVGWIGQNELTNLRAIGQQIPMPLAPGLYRVG